VAAIPDVSEMVASSAVPIAPTSLAETPVISTASVVDLGSSPFDAHEIAAGVLHLLSLCSRGVNALRTRLGLEPLALGDGGTDVAASVRGAWARGCARISGGWQTAKLALASTMEIKAANVPADSNTPKHPVAATLAAPLAAASAPPAAALSTASPVAGIPLSFSPPPPPATSSFPSELVWSLIGLAAVTIFVRDVIIR